MITAHTARLAMMTAAVAGSCPSTSTSGPANPAPANSATEVSVEFCGRELPPSTVEVSCENPRVTDLAPLAVLVNLQKLDLDDTSVFDLSPLAACHELEWLSIRRTRVESVAVLEDLDNLRLLNAGGAPIDLDEVGRLGQLWALEVSATTTSLDSLDTLELHRLTVGSDSVTDISALSGKSFGFLGLHLSQLRDISPLGMVHVNDLELDLPALADVSPLIQVEGLERLELATAADLGPLTECEVKGLEALAITAPRGTVPEPLVLELRACTEVFNLRQP